MTDDDTCVFLEASKQFQLMDRCRHHKGIPPFFPVINRYQKTRPFPHPMKNILSVLIGLEGVVGVNY